MKTRLILCACLILTVIMIYPLTAYSQEPKPIKLSAPRAESGKSLVQALKERKTMREFSPRELPLQVLSEMLWAACGVNRPDSGGRTAPSAMNMQEIDIYVATKDGLYLFNAKENILEPILAEDIRGLTGKQAFVKEAPVNLIYVANMSKMSKLSPENASFYAATDTGFISENVYLYCASEGLATVVRGWVDKPTLAKAMKLGSDKMIVLAQTVGYPKD